MELTEAVRRRRMTRRFLPDPIDPPLLDSLLESALRAPSAGFAQAVELLVLTAEDARRSFWSLNSSPEWRESSRQAPGLLAAPVIVLPGADPAAYQRRYAAPDKAGSGLAGLSPEEWPAPYWLVDAAFAVMTLLLASTDAGIGALFFRLRATPEQLRARFGLPRGLELIGAVALGRPDHGRARQAPARGRPPKRPLGETVHRDHW